MKDTRILYALAGVTNILTFIFITLKEVGLVHWSWLAVFSPTLGFMALATIFGLFALGIAVVQRINKQ